MNFNSAHRRLLLNHLPITGCIIVILVLAYGILRRSEAVGVAALAALFIKRRQFLSYLLLFFIHVNTNFRVKRCYWNITGAAEANAHQQHMFRIVNKFFLTIVWVVLFGSVSLFAQQMPMKMDSANTTNKRAMPTNIQMDEEIPHPFFTHMGMPEAVGTFSLRTAALVTKQVDGRTKGDFAFHFETGLSRTVGIHIRNDRFLMNPTTEIMFQFAVIKSKSGMNGISTLIEFEIPTSKGVKRINTLVGFSSTLGNSRVAFNQVLHYNPRVDMLDGSIALVFKVTSKIFLVTEMLGTRMPDGIVMLNPLAGVKVRLNKNIILGLGYMRPVTTNKEFSSQSIFQPDFGW